MAAKGPKKKKKNVYGGAIIWIRTQPSTLRGRWLCAFSFPHNKSERTQWIYQS